MGRRKSERGTSPYRVWWKPEFDECKNQEQLDDLAWSVPDEHGLFNPEVRIPCDDPEDAAKKYADYYHSERDGYEDTWPVDFVVGIRGKTPEEGETYVVVSVDRDFDPVFTSADPVPCTPAFAAPAQTEPDDRVRSAGG